MQAAEHHKRQTDEYIRVAEGMRALFISKDKKGLWQADVIDSVKSNPNGTFSTDDEIRTIIVGISKILPEWIKLFSIPKGAFMRMDKDRIPILQIRERIQKHFKQNANKKN